MSRTDHLRVEIYNDVAGKPYIILEASGRKGEDMSAPAIEVKMWANSIEIVDYRREEK